MSVVVETTEALDASTSFGEGLSKRSGYVDAVIDFTGGVAGGIATVYVGQPLDTVKVKVQTFPKFYRNAFHCFAQTYKHEGIVRGLYAGTVPSLAANISENAILFTAYGQCQKGMAFLRGKNDVASLTALENALSGGSAAFFSSLALCPTELIKCKLQAMEQIKTTDQVKNIGDKKMGPWSLTRHILRTEGIQGMFRGLVPTFAREMPGYCFFFGGYELCRTLLTPEGKSKDDLGPFATMFCGAMGGASLWTAVFPADVIKSRAQVEIAGAEQNTGFVRTFFLILRTEGVRALYRGLGPTLLRTIPATGALFLAYESVKKFLTNKADVYL